MRVVVKSILASVDRGVWLRFLVALGGLGLALAAALFSTVARESGNVLATAVLASVALALAAVVAVTTVPYLARRVASRRLRDVFDYEVTREGIVYALATLVIAVAALNTGNNLLFLVVSAMLAAVVVSGVASARMLRGLELEVSVPGHVFAGQTMLALVSLRNQRQRAPAFSVSVVPAKSKSRKTESVAAAATGGETRDGRRGAILTAPVYFPYVAAKAEARAEVELCFAGRGEYRQEGFGLATRFPFSFLKKTRRVALERAVVVYPPVEPTEEFFEVLPMITGEFEQFVRGRGHDLYRIREYAPEDSKRFVDWKATARSQSLKVREFTREDERKLRIVFDNPAPGAVAEPAYEKAVATCASLAWHFAAEATELSFVAPGYGGSAEVHDFLRYLALVSPAEAEQVLDALEVSDDYNIVLTARARGTIPTRLWASSYFIFMEWLEASG